VWPLDISRGSCIIGAPDPIRSEAAMGEWEFYRIPAAGADDAPFHWSWRCVQEDGSVLTTPHTFRFFLDCVAHARLHGYCNGPLLTRRDAPCGVLPLPRLTGMHASARAQ
jgi:hypothetical protein